MAKVSLNTLLLLRRAYSSVAAENVKVVQTAAASVIRTVGGGSGGGGGGGVIQGVEKEEFWMRDPNTGNWIPEKHFNEVDVADLRKKFLSKKQ